MSGTKKSQANLDSFFKAPQPATSVSSRPSSTPKGGSRSPPPSSSTKSKVSPVTSTVASASRPADQPAYTSSLPAPPSSDPPPQQAAEPPVVSSSALSGRIVKSSDDEDSGSDSSLVDLSTLLQSSRSKYQSKASADKPTPSTPTASRFPSRDVESKTSPLVVPKYKFDLKYLARLAKADDAIEASAKRVKALSAPRGEAGPRGVNQDAKSSHLDLLESVVAEREGGEIQSVTRALKRTEVSLAEHRWYFFGHHDRSGKQESLPFPAQFVPATWKDDLLSPQSRYQTFISGFAEDMISFGRALPDEIFLWMIDELCREPSDPLRNSYCNALEASSEQVERLVDVDLIQKLFRDLGGSPTAISIAQEISPTQGIVEPYVKREWGKLYTVVRFLGRIAKHLQQKARVHAICMLLRLAVDRVVFDNVDLLDIFQGAINRLCRYIPSEAWEASCQEICASLFKCVKHATFRLQVVECIPSISSRAHDLRRRLAMCFYFNEISYSSKHSHHLMSPSRFITRLEDESFDITPQTDYQELAALVSLLDIAVDDARSVGLDLTDKDQERRFDRDIDDLAASVKDLMKGIGNPGAAFISKIEAKEVLELVAQRIGDTLRSKPKPKQTVFGGPRQKEEDLAGERAGIQSFLAKMNATRTANGQPAAGS